MDIRWLGKRSVRIEGDEVSLVVDPGPGDAEGAAIVAFSVRDAENHRHSEGEGFRIDGPGEYEVHGAFIVAVQTEAMSAGAGKANGAGSPQSVLNTVYAIELDDLSICHLGALGHKLDRQQVEAIGPVDVLIVPVGGVDALGPALAAEVVGQLDPAIVVPVNHVAGDLDGLGLASVEKFIEEMGVSPDEAEPILKVSTTRIPDETQLRVLERSSR